MLTYSGLNRLEAVHLKGLSITKQTKGLSLKWCWWCTDEAEMGPSPLYNMSVLEDMGPTMELQALQAFLKNNEPLRQATVLLKVRYIQNK